MSKIRSIAILLMICLYSGGYGQIAVIPGEVSTEFGTYRPHWVNVVPAVPAYTCNPDFTDVENFGTLGYGFSDAEKQLLRTNLFVVKPEAFAQTYSLYYDAEQSNLPQFVTTDALLHTFHVLYDYSLRAVETQKLAGDLSELNHVLLGQMEEYFSAITGPTDSAVRNAAERDVAYFTTVEYLPTSAQFLSTYDTASQAQRWAAGELELIGAHAGFDTSRIFGGTYTEDYSQYVPRGHYTRTITLQNFFRQMMWYGRMACRVSPPVNAMSDEIDEEQARKETLMAILMVRALNECTVNGEPALDVWNRIYYPTTFFVGKSDDLTIVEYSKLLEDIYGSGYVSLPLREFGDTTKLTAFIEAARLLRNPLINSSWVSENQDAASVTKGFRFMGQRFIPDSYMFTQLVHAKVSDRLMPKGLDVMSVLGSQRAFEILDHIFGETAYQNYTVRMDSLRREFAALSPEHWAQNLYWNWLYCLQSLLVTKGAGYPAFMTNEAWADKDLFTALASWAQLRHDTILYGKQSYTQTTGEPNDRLTYGYVEPNPFLFARLASLVQLMDLGFDKLGLSLDVFRPKYDALQSLLLGLTEISIKELENKEITPAEYYLIWTINVQLQNLVTFPPDVAGSITNSADASMATVADVHTDSNTQSVLEEGVGYPFTLYTIVNDGKGKRLTTGAVFSYFEFTHPMSDRLTDEAWKSMLKSVQPPVRPVWAGSFMDTLTPLFMYRWMNDSLAIGIMGDPNPPAPTFSPDRIDIGDTLAFSILLPWHVDTLRITFSRDGNILAGSGLTGTPDSGMYRFSGNFATNGWPAGVVTVELFSGNYTATRWLEVGYVSGIADQPPVPKTFQLFQNYPNPFNPATTIRFGLPEAAAVDIRIYDMTGREVEILAHKRMNPGWHVLRWDGSGHSSGVYFCVMRTDNVVVSRKLVYLK